MNEKRKKLKNQKDLKIHTGTLLFFVCHTGVIYFFVILQLAEIEYIYVTYRKKGLALLKKVQVYCIGEDK
jgi:hypothetical protein